MKRPPFKEGTDGEFIARMHERRILSREQCNGLAARIGYARHMCNEHKLGMRSERPEA